MKNFKNQLSKTSIIFSIFFVVTISLSSCIKEGRTEGNRSDERNRTEMLKHIIPVSDAVEMYGLYKKERLDITKNYLQQQYGQDFKDTKTVWLDINNLKEYIRYVEEKSREVGVKPTGLQFYFSVYPSRIEDNKRNHQTFFIAPTKRNGKIQSGYTLENVGGKETAVYFNELIKKGTSSVERASFFATAMQGNNSLFYNRNVPNPPGNDN